MFQGTRVASAMLAGSALLAACGTSTIGNLNAAPGGDTSHPAERGSPVTELEAACGTGGMTAAGETTLPRRPYLQQVTSTSAIVGWMTSEPATAQRVVITTPEGAAVSAAPAEVEEKTVVRIAGDRQVWSEFAGLEPDTIYCYAVANETASLVERAGFRTAPATGSDGPVRFLAFGDSGSGNGDQHALLDQMHTVPFDLMIHTGDLAYDSGTIDEIEEQVFGVYQDLFRSKAFFPSPGNHDYETASGAPYRGVFALPNNERWYSYDWGNVHFVVLDTNASNLATQAAWLEADLAASQQPWKIVYLHHPPYSSGHHGSDTGVRKTFGPIFEEQGVQLVLAGHDHHYERMKPQNGVAYIVTGGGGRGTRSAGAESFTAHSDEVIHFVYGETKGDELILHAIDGSGFEFDSLVIQR